MTLATVVRRLRWPALVIFVVYALYRIIDAFVDEWGEHAGLQDTAEISGLPYRDLTGLEQVGVLLFGDFGWPIADQQTVADSMWERCAAVPCDLAVTLGDNIYPEGITSLEDPGLVASFEKPFSKFIEAADREFWMAVGNHDIRGSVRAQIAYSEHSPIWRLPARDYHIPGLPEWLNIYVLDTNFIAGGSKFPNFQRDYEENFAAQLGRAADALCGKDGWRVLTTHHPPLASSTKPNLFRERNMHAAMRDFIRDCDIDMVWSGHQHLQEHIQYDGVEYLIQGAASKVRTSRWEPHEPAARSIFLSSQLGFGQLQIDAATASIEYLDRDGKVIHSARIQRALRPSESPDQENP